MWRHDWIGQHVTFDVKIARVIAQNRLTRTAEAGGKGNLKEKQKNMTLISSISNIDRHEREVGGKGRGKGGKKARIKRCFIGDKALTGRDPEN